MLNTLLKYKQTHPTLPLSIWNYTAKVQWEGLWDDVTLICRGLVIDDTTGEIVARPFKKFFNLSEGRTLVTMNYTVFDKLDGSLGILFNYHGEWVFASRGSFTSEQAVWFKEYFLNNYNFSSLEPDNTYCFEIIYQNNRIVVKYDYEDVVLTGVFNTSTGEEQHLKWGDINSVQELYGFKSLSLFELSETIADDKEGYVIRFDNGERCKIKGAEYLRLHKLMSEMSSTSVWECLYNDTPIENSITNLPDEFFQIVKTYELRLKMLYDQEAGKISMEYMTLCNIFGDCDDKTFALAVKDSPYKSILFDIRKGKDAKKKVWRLVKPKYFRL